MTSPTSKLGDLLELVIDHRGKTPKKLGGEFTNQGVPVVSAIHIKNGQINWSERERFVSQSMFEKWMQVRLQKDDVLLTSEAPLGEVALVESDNPLVLSQRLFALRCRESVIDPRFLKHFLSSPLGQALLQERASGSTVLGIKQSELLQIEIPMLPVSQQVRIGAFLERIDSKIRLNQQLSLTLESIAQTIFKSWFIDFDPVHAKARGEQPEGMDAETAALFPDSFDDSDLGPIPAGWTVSPSAEIFDFSIGRTPPRKEPEWFCEGANGVPWVSIRDMGNFGVYTALTNEGLHERAVSKFRVPIVPAGTVLMSFKLTLGRVAIARVPLTTNEAIAHFIPRESDSLPSEFAYLWLKNLDYTSLDSTSSIGTATNSSLVKQILFLQPSTQVIQSFVEVCKPIFEQIKNLTLQSEALGSIRDSLLPRLISGELEIPEELLGE